jgi:tetratricopeptide (TPR) repeat protein
MSSRLRVRVLVAVVAAAAVGIVLGVTLATRETPPKRVAHAGKPPLAKVLPTPEAAKIRAAYKTWPHGSLNEMVALGADYPHDPVVQLYLGIALIWSGYDANAEASLKAAKKWGRNTSIEIQADSLLHPQYFPDDPIFTPTSDNPLLERGSKLQQEGHQHSAEALYERAVRKNPNDVEALVAQAVGRFDKDNLNASFSQLGPLTQRFPKSQLVRYYLGYLLAVTGQGDAAVVQFQKTVALGPKTVLGQNAEAFLVKLKQAATAAASK